MKTCTVDGCDKPCRARGLCSTHYNQQHQPERHKKVTIACDHCGAEVEKQPSSKYGARFCSLICRDLWRIETGTNPAPPYREPKPKPPRRDLRSPLRRAIEDGDREGVIAAVLADCDVRPNGCWEWQRIVKDYYPVVRINGRDKQVHRLTLEARLGALLGKQAAHHRCANTFCVNPDHLQPVTARENTAEMLARTYMETRIRELEAALVTLNPRHPLLSEVGIPAA